MEIIAKLDEEDETMVKLYHGFTGELSLMCVVYIDDFLCADGFPPQFEFDKMFEDNPDGVKLELTLKG